MAKKFTNSGQYKKGEIPWSALNKGKYSLGPCSEETKKKIGKANSKPKVYKDCLTCKVSFGMWPSKAETRFYCSKVCSIEGQKGKASWNKGLEGYGAGRKHTEETKLKMSIAIKKALDDDYLRSLRTGENSHRWQGGRIRVNEKKHLCGKYIRWMKAVKNRDKWTCRIADDKCNGRLEAHHILRWKDYPELRYEVNNGISLCAFHHPRKIKDEERLIPTFRELVLNVN